MEARTRRFRLAVRVKPGSRRPLVGGSWGSARALVVAVREPAVEGRANRAVVEALADALNVRRRTITIVKGSRSRDKIIEITEPPDHIAARVHRLIAGRLSEDLGP